MAWKKIGIVGLGTMGQAIAEMLAKKQYTVLVQDATPELMEQAIKAIDGQLEKQVSRWSLTGAEKKSILTHIQCVASLDDFAQCDLVIETITEDAQAKHALFARLGHVCPEHVVLATNTSTLSVTECARATVHAQRVIGTHFIFPVSNVEMVEIIRGLQTDQTTADAVRAFVEQGLEMKAIPVYESPGFVTTRLICTLINEALHVYTEGVAHPRDIDDAMRIGYGFRHGPLEMADRFGLDAVLAALEGMFREYGDLKYRPAVLLRKMVRAHQLGVKTGQGFFRYDDDGDRIR